MRFTHWLGKTFLPLALAAALLSASALPILAEESPSAAGNAGQAPAGTVETGAEADPGGQDGGGSGTGDSSEREETSATSSYEEYLAGLPEGARPAGETVRWQAEDYSAGEGAAAVSAEPDGSEGQSLLSSDTGWVEWVVNVPETGLYNLTVRYYPTEYKGSSIERTLLIDGATPYDEAQYLTFTRIWTDVGEITQDSTGNDVRPSQEERPRWVEYTVRDASEYVEDPLQFYLTEGRHTIRLEAVKEEFALDWLELSPPEDVPTYAEYAAGNAGYSAPDAETIRIDAERPDEKSDVTLYPVYDRTSAASDPQNPIKIRLNTIGGSKWQMPGQWITWRFYVEKEGLYNIAPRFRQNIYSGMYTTRRLLLDGEVPFEEAKALSFNFDSSWQREVLGDENGAFAFRLDEGWHTLTMEVTLGPMAPIIAEVTEILESLNADYRRILILTGPSPDTYRDYGFDKMIPDVIDDLAEQAGRLDAVIEQLKQEVGKTGEQVSLLTKLSFQVRRMAEKPSTIARSFTNFKDNLGSLGAWLLTARQQPLELDYIEVVPDGAEIPGAEAGFIDSAVFFIQSFALSFFEDYRSVGGGYTEADEAAGNVIKVWLATGRDQAQIIRQLIDASFTPDTGIKVNLQLVTAGTLLPATLSGMGPDVSLSNAIGDPINYAIRGAAVELSQFEGFDEVIQRFHPSAVLPFQYKGYTYALPETQSFPMFFYRTDIFEELGLTPPETWEDFYEMVPVLQRNNLQVGFPVSTTVSPVEGANLNGLCVFLYQKNGSLYKEDGLKTNLDSDEVLSSFKEMTDLFTLYKFPVQYDFANRFRTGEMPCGIVDYTMYNQLTAFAPEIKGLWSFTQVPGTVQEDGTVNHAVPSTGLSVMMMSSAQDKQKAWEFMDWWTSADTQSRFGIEMESVLGAAAKQPTANMEALESLPWSAKDYESLMTQWESAAATPQVPGGYYTTRVVDFAFNRVYTSGDNPVSTMLDYIKETNEELARKHEEFASLYE